MMAPVQPPVSFAVGTASPVKSAGQLLLRAVVPSEAVPVNAIEEMVGAAVATLAAAVAIAAVPSSHPITRAGMAPLTSDLNAASLALVLAVLSEAKTTEDKMPMMAITTKSSIKVKPFSLFLEKYIILDLILNCSREQFFDS